MNEKPLVSPSASASSKAAASKRPQTGFVDYIIRRCRTDTRVRAALRRANNPELEYQSWDVLADYKIDLDKAYERLPYLTVAAAIANANASANGNTRLGRAIARCFEDDHASESARRRMRRLLACDSTEELCRILRPELAMIQSKSGATLDYAQLLNDLRWFHVDESRDRIKSRWAQDFYNKKPVKNVEDQGVDHADAG